MRFILIFIFTINFPFLVMGQTTFATSSTILYRIKPDAKSIMHIARDVYDDEKVWKDIVSWNKMTAPYNFQAGQVLTLHRVTNLKYRVKEKAPLLSMIALENYGNVKMASVIARWNDLSVGEPLKIGQLLKLKIPPTLFLDDRRAMLARMWKKLKREDMVAQIENEANSPLFNPGRRLAGKSENTSIKPAMTAKKSSSNELTTTTTSSKSVKTSTSNESSNVTTSNESSNVTSATESTNTTSSVEGLKAAHSPELPEAVPSPQPAGPPQAPTAAASPPQPPKPIIPPELPKPLVQVDKVAPDQEIRKPAGFQEPGMESYWLGDDAPKIFRRLSPDQKTNPSP
jgi:hypothetical protein